MNSVTVRMEINDGAVELDGERVIINAGEHQVVLAPDLVREIEEKRRGQRQVLWRARAEVEETDYNIGHFEARILRQLAKEPEERAAIERLLEFRGTSDDVMTASAIYQRTGRPDSARFLLEMLSR